MVALACTVAFGVEVVSSWGEEEAYTWASLGVEEHTVVSLGVEVCRMDQVDEVVHQGLR